MIVQLMLCELEFPAAAFLVFPNLCFKSGFYTIPHIIS